MTHFVVFGWREDYSDRIIPNIPVQFGIQCYTEETYCRGHVIYGMKCMYNKELDYFHLSKNNQNKVTQAYIHYNIKYRDDNNQHFKDLRFMEATHSDDLETIYKYLD